MSTVHGSVSILFGFADVFVCQTINKNPSFITFISRQNMCSSLQAIKQNINHKKVYVCVALLACTRGKEHFSVGQTIAADRCASAYDILHSYVVALNGGVNRR